ncbi:MAG: hypothetical protein COB26_02890 [Piscirickettsiaceae bacterium]|nr:MAG: hypothetical protein COB26_02890 [Piscirickettsiaceae bacterium]
MTFHTISVVIPTHKRPDLLDKLLTSIYKAYRPPSIIEIIVVENGGEYGANLICNKWQEKLPLKYTFEPEASVSNARNTGTKIAEGDVVLFFDDDIRCDEGIFISYDKAIQQHGDKYFYGGCLEIDYETKPAEWLLKFLPNSVKGMHLHNQETIIKEGLFLGANHAIPRKFFADIAEYDLFCETKDLIAIGEETRLQEQLINEGIYGLYLPDAKVWHYVPEKRCNEEWAINRRYRYGLTQGVLHANENTSGKKLFGVPIWVIRKKLALQFKMLYANFFNTQDKEEIIKSKLKLAEANGLIDGYKKSNI